MHDTALPSDWAGPHRFGPPPWAAFAMTGPAGRGRGRRRRHHGPEGFDFPPGPFFGRGNRRGRGSIRLAILALLAEEPMHGYQVIQELTARSGGTWRPSPGSVYPTLQQLEDEGLVRAEDADGRRVFHLTEAGQAAARAVPSAPWETAAGDVDEDLLALRDLAFQVGAAVMQVARAGTADHLQRAKEILADTRRRLYRLLAEDPTEQPAAPEREAGTDEPAAT